MGQNRNTANSQRDLATAAEGIFLQLGRMRLRGIILPQTRESIRKLECQKRLSRAPYGCSRGKGTESSSSSSFGIMPPQCISRSAYPLVMFSVQ